MRKTHTHADYPLMTAMGRSLNALELIPARWPGSRNHDADARAATPCQSTHATRFAHAGHAAGRSGLQQYAHVSTTSVTSLYDSGAYARMVPPAPAPHLKLP